MNTVKEWFEDMISWPEHGATRNEVKDILRSQKKRDWEEFREIVSDNFKYANTVLKDEYLPGVGFLSAKIMSQIDSKLAELDKPKK